MMIRYVYERLPVSDTFNGLMVSAEISDESQFINLCSFLRDERQMLSFV